MSDSTSTDESTTETPKPKKAQAPVSGGASSSTRLIASAGLVISLLAAAAAGWALFKPATTESAAGPSSTTGSSAPENDNPKTTVCKAFRTVSDAVFLQTNRTPSPELGPAIPAAAEGIAANARLAMAGGANFLLDTMPSNTPEELAGDVRRFADDLNNIAMNALAGIPNDKPEQSALLKNADELNTKIGDLCK